MHILPTSSSKNAPSLRAHHFWFNMLKCTSSSRSSLVQVLPTSSSKSAPSLRARHFGFNMLKFKSSPRFSLVHILPTSSSKSAPSPLFLFNMLKCKSSSRFSLVHILPTSSSKSAPSPSFLFNMLKCKSSSRFSPVCTFCRQRLQVEHRTRGKDPIYYTLATTEATLPEKHRISCPRVLVCEFTRSRPATLPNYFMMGGWSWWCGWHDDVVDMMMWSTWWCGWHDGGNANHENRFLTKLPLINIYIYQLTPMIPG